MNRCEVRVLLRKELERRLKEQRYSLVDSRLWLGGNLRCLWWKRVALDSDKEGLVQKNGFGFVKKAAFECRLESFSTKKKRFCFAKKACFFSLCKTTWRRKALGLQKSQRFQLIQSQPIKKSLFLQHSKDLTSHRTQNNVQQPFSNIACHCELAAKQPIFETS